MSCCYLQFVHHVQDSTRTRYCLIPVLIPFITNPEKLSMGNLPIICGCGSCSTDRISVAGLGHAADFQEVFTYLEKMLQDPYPIPLSFPSDFLQTITHNFSTERELGRGGSGVVYKGILQNGYEIAVKKLTTSEMNLNDQEFQKEVTYQVGLKQQNIVQLIGYCAESRWEVRQVEEEYVMADIRKRFLCFEYLNNKSLDAHIFDQSCGLEWDIRYKIIKGICMGLDYLHTEGKLIHLDLKPENILLDAEFVPKIADFGISRPLGEQQSRIITNIRRGTPGYMAPELFLHKGLVTTKADMFSFGVIIIALMTGSKDPYPSDTERFIESVIGKWMNRWERASDVPMELYSQQVNRCIKIGLECVHPDPEKRPDARKIIENLHAV